MSFYLVAVYEKPLSVILIIGLILVSHSAIFASVNCCHDQSSCTSMSTLCWSLRNYCMPLNVCLSRGGHPLFGGYTHAQEWRPSNWITRHLLISCQHLFLCRHLFCPTLYWKLPASRPPHNHLGRAATRGNLRAGITHTHTHLHGKISR